MGFDLAAFTEQTIDEPLKHVRELPDEGEYEAFVHDFKMEEGDLFRTIKSNKTGEEYLLASIPFRLVGPAAEAQKQKLGYTDMERPLIVRYKDLFLNFKPGTQELDTGPNQNVELGQIRKALGLTTGQIWAPMRGAGPVKVRVRHRNIDQNDPERKIAEIVRVTEA